MHVHKTYEVIFDEFHPEPVFFSASPTYPDFTAASFPRAKAMWSRFSNQRIP